MGTKKKPVKKSTVAASKPDKKIEMQLRHTFTATETIEIARKMAEASRELNQAEEEKKAVTSQLKAKVDGIAARVTEHAGKINSGFEYRNTAVLVKYNTPKTGQKQLTRLDTNEVIGNEEMSMAEMQTELPLSDAKAPVVPFNPVLKEDDAKKVTASPGTVGVPADGGTVDSEDAN
jgi:hypothetical protein